MAKMHSIIIKVNENRKYTNKTEFKKIIIIKFYRHKK